MKIIDILFPERTLCGAAVRSNKESSCTEVYKIIVS